MNEKDHGHVGVEVHGYFQAAGENIGMKG